MTSKRGEKVKCLNQCIIILLFPLELLFENMKMFIVLCLVLSFCPWYKGWYPNSSYVILTLVTHFVEFRGVSSNKLGQVFFC